VSTLGLWPEHFLLTTGTFNLVVKDRIAFRLSGAYSVQKDLMCSCRACARPDGSETRPHTKNSSVLETL